MPVSRVDEFTAQDTETATKSDTATVTALGIFGA